MKKIRLTAWILLAVMLLAFASSCGSAVGSSETSSDSTEQTENTTPASTSSGDTENTPSVEDTTKEPDSSSTPTRPSGGVTDGLPEEMPVFHINTNNIPIVSKEEYIVGALTVDNTEEAYAMTDAAIEIRGRGNYSWTDTEKKSYRIKFAEKTNLLGQGNGPARSWTLLAVHCDQSLLRTAAAFYFARSLTGIDYTSSASFAKVYLNGEYLGVYQVSEQMQVQDYRVNINDSETDAEDIDFLIELDQMAEDIFDGQNHYEIKSDWWTESQREYIVYSVYDAWEAVLGGAQSDVEALLDIDSVVDTYIVEELFKNLDAGWGSFYMYQEVGGKLHFGPVWDFDLSTGNADDNYKNPFFPMPQYLYVGSTEFTNNQVNYWFVNLMQQQWFRDKVAARWDEITEELNAIVPYIQAVAEMYSEEFDSNFERWPIFGQKINREPAQVQALKNHDEHVVYLCDWLTARIEWLNLYFDGEVDGDPAPGASPYDFVGSGGKGTQEDPYRVSTAKDFNEMANCMKFGADFRGKYFIQTADIDMAGYVGYTGVGSSYTFAGYYNGNGYRINATLAGNDECLFPYVTGTVINVISTGSVTNYQQAAGIARSVRDGGALINCLSTMKVTSVGQNAGGITASNQRGATIMGCVFMGEITFAQSGHAINCYMNNREGTFTYNYYIDTAVGNITGVNGISDTAFALADLNATVTAMNRNQTAMNNYRNALCRWTIEDGVLALSHK